MNELDVLTLFISEIEPLVDCDVHMAGVDEEHESDIILLDELNTTRKLRATNPYSGIARDENGNPTGEKKSIYYEARLDLLAKSESEVTAYELRNAIQEHFYQYESDPESLGPDLVRFEVGDGGKRHYDWEPTVFRIFEQTQAFHFEFVDIVEHDADVLEQIDDNL